MRLSSKLDKRPRFTLPGMKKEHQTRMLPMIDGSYSSAANWWWASEAGSWRAKFQAAVQKNFHFFLNKQNIKQCSKKKSINVEALNPTIFDINNLKPN